MLAVSLSALAREIWAECDFKRDTALAKLVARITSDKALFHECIREAAATALARIASDQRTYLHEAAGRAARAGADDTRGLHAIARGGYLDAYDVLGDRLGDCTRADLDRFVAHHSSLATTAAQRVRFGRAILKSKKFIEGKRVRDCFSEIDIARIAEETET